MQKINWRNGTLISKAKVVIDGIIHEVEPEEYEGQTPLSAEMLNQMQENIENSIEDNLESEDETKFLSAKQGKVLNEKVKGTILWENDNLSSDFDPQTITLANSNWDYIEIYVTKIGCIRITKEQALEEICMNSCYGLAGLKLVVKYRNLSVINNCSKINFQEGYAYEQNNGVTLGSIDNSVIKPIKIIGYTY